MEVKGQLSGVILSFHTVKAGSNLLLSVLCAPGWRVSKLLAYSASTAHLATGVLQLQTHKTPVWILEA